MLPASTGIKFAGTQFYIWEETGTVRVKCIAQEHNTMSPVRAPTIDHWVLNNEELAYSLSFITETCVL